MNEKKTPIDPELMAPSRGESVRTLILALLLLTAIIIAVMSCGGGDDLTFPGQVPFTDTPGNTNTPTPVPTTTG
jgi:hypothetical protein